MSVISVLMLGLLLGMKHATEADHLAAVATLVSRKMSAGQAMRHGIGWGIGHTLTLAVFAGLVLSLGKQVPDPVARWLEFIVGGMLVVLGVDVLLRLARERVHFHVHEHDTGARHVHSHSHAGEGEHRESPHRHTHDRKLPLRAVTVGMIHGMAGSAALVLLSLEAVQSPLMGLLYIALFGVGSIAGMALLSVVIAVPLRLSAERLNRLHHGLTLVVGAFSCAIGIFVMYQQWMAAVSA